MRVHLGGRCLLFADTPGHALHHHCVWDETTAGWFSGDTFGLSYREFDTARGPWILASSTPVQFDPAALRGSVARLLERQPRCIYLTHYGRVGDVARLGAELLHMLQDMVAIGQCARGVPERHARLREALFAMYLRGLRAHGCTRDEADCADLLEMDVQLNAQGLGVWLDRQ
jgi:glyoxylase-like metal-dependent hydrolase (beta-lactamase superfamily II)